jgi:hypothetical protein
VEKYCRARQATDDDIVVHRRFACWITKVTDTHSNVFIFIALPREHILRPSALVLGIYVIACLVFVYVALYVIHAVKKGRQIKKEILCILLSIQH